MTFRSILAGTATYRGADGDRGDAYYAHSGLVVIHHGRITWY
jgi:hypothetical protein